MSASAVELRAISKRFGAVVANDAIDLVLTRGTVHAVMGENGAGKSTLMSILFGLVRPDSGEILVDGESRSFHTPSMRSPPDSGWCTSISGSSTR